MIRKKSLFWADQFATKVVNREADLQRGIDTFRVESGLGASGIPHIGSLGDVLRQYAVKLSLEDLGERSELIAYSDDRDGLRKVPSGFDSSLEKYIGMPVTAIPDPFRCHRSYGEHMSSILIDAMDKIGLEYTFKSATEVYKSGVLDDQIEKLLANYKKIGTIIKEMVGQDKFLQAYPYYPVCEKCGRVYTTRVVDVFEKEKKVSYSCDQEFKGKNQTTGNAVIVNGCGHKGEASFAKGEGKLAWKVEFATRWAALKIVFEAAGKDIRDSVNINDRVCKEILGFEPPIHLFYELFLETGGKKISKSVGNVFTAQDWLKYGSKKSLALLMFKRATGTRELSPQDIPKYMNEVDDLDRIFFGEKAITNSKESVQLKRLYQFVNLMKTPSKPSLRINYDTVVNLTKVLPVQKEDRLKVISEILEHTGHFKKSDDIKELEERLDYAANWLSVMKDEIKTVSVPISEDEKAALKEFAGSLKKGMAADDIQALVFDIVKRNDLDAAKFFRILYAAILGIERGPKIGKLASILGEEKVANAINRYISSV
ncbi:MAG: lysine--tRNA ligase [Candidatus Aenigmarchaeota archaeon]|nr:lysine--tRNA ligase [Candidatus Aenigmarchaeota archaeon]